MKILLLSLLLFTPFTLLFAQADSTNVPSVLVGLEANIHFMDVDFYQSDFRYYGYGLHVEKPIGQFSVGTGLIKQHFSAHRFYTSTGEYRPAEGGQRERFGYNYEVQEVSFITIPLRLNYRLPCNCIHIQGGLLANFRELHQIANNQEAFLLSAPESNTYAVSDIKSLSLGYELAFGMNMHISSSLKMIGKVAYLQYSFLNDANQQFKQLGNTFWVLGIGLQYAIYKQSKNKKAVFHTK